MFITIMFKGIKKFLHKRAAKKTSYADGRALPPAPPPSPVSSKNSFFSEERFSEKRYSEAEPDSTESTKRAEFNYHSAILSSHDNLIISIVPAIMDYIEDYSDHEFKAFLDDVFNNSFAEVELLEHLVQHPISEKKPLLAENIQHSLTVWSIFIKLFEQYRKPVNNTLTDNTMADKKNSSDELYSRFIICLLLSLKYNADANFSNANFTHFYAGTNLFSPPIQLDTINALERKYLNAIDWQLSDLDMLSDEELYAVIKDIERRADKYNNYKAPQLAPMKNFFTKVQYLPWHTAKKAHTAAPEEISLDHAIEEKSTGESNKSSRLG
jgi:hypothetical protein